MVGARQVLILNFGSTSTLVKVGVEDLGIGAVLLVGSGSLPWLLAEQVVSWLHPSLMRAHTLAMMVSVLVGSSARAGGAEAGA